MSSKENEIVIQHQKDLLEVFGSVLDCCAIPILGHPV